MSKEKITVTRHDADYGVSGQAVKTSLSFGGGVVAASLAAMSLAVAVVGVLAFIILTATLLAVTAAIMWVIEAAFAHRAQPRWHDIMDEPDPTKEEL